MKGNRRVQLGQDIEILSHPIKNNCQIQTLSLSHTQKLQTFLNQKTVDLGIWKIEMKIQEMLWARLHLWKGKIPQTTPLSKQKIPPDKILPASFGCFSPNLPYYTQFLWLSFLTTLAKTRLLSTAFKMLFDLNFSTRTCDYTYHDSRINIASSDHMQKNVLRIILCIPRRQKYKESSALFRTLLNPNYCILAKPRPPCQCQEDCR